MGLEDLQRAQAERFDARPLHRAGADREPIRALLEASRDLYLCGLQEQLEASTGQRVSKPHLWKIAGELGFLLKKSRSTPANETRKGTGSGAPLS